MSRPTLTHAAQTHDRRAVAGGDGCAPERSRCTERCSGESGDKGKSRFVAVLESAPDGIVSIDRDRRITLFSAAAERMFGCAAGEALGAPIDRFIRLSPHQEAAFDLPDALANRAGPQFRTTPLPLVATRTNGEEFAAEATFAWVEAGGQPELAVFLRDVSERQEAERRALDMEKLRAVGQMASGVAHHVNQYLALVSGHAEMALEELSDPSPDLARLRELAQVAVTAAGEAGEVANRLLAYASGTQRGNAETIEASSLLRETVRLTEPRVRSVNQELDGGCIAIRVQADADLWMDGSPQALTQALVSLVLNAVDALPNGGTISLEAHRSSEGNVAITVSDDGVGMAPEVRERALEPFFTTKGEKGVGLGLPQVFTVVEQHGGAMDLDSAVGRGTRVRLTLPASRAGARVRAGGGSGGEGKSEGCESGRLRILVVDDEARLARMAAQVMGRQGHHTVVLTSGEAAVAALESERFDLVLSDLVMGEGMNGWQLAEWVHSRQPRVRFVLTTGWGAGIDPAEARERGVEEVVNKPYRLADLRRLTALTTERTREGAS